MSEFTHTIQFHHDPQSGTYEASIADLPGCFVSGQTLPEVYEALAEAVAFSQQAWTITVSVPAYLSEDLRTSLFDAVADAAHEWEPEQRDGWDVDVSASDGKTFDPHSEAHALVLVDVWLSRRTRENRIAAIEALQAVTDDETT